MRLDTGLSTEPGKVLSRSSLVRHWLVYVVVRVFICIIQSMRLETCAVLARALARLASDIVGVRRQVLNENLRHAYPDLTETERKNMARDMWEHLLLMLCEIALASRKIHETNWRDHVTLHDKELLVRLLLAPRPTVLVTGHFGNFEMAGYVAGLLGFPTFTIARPLDNPFLNDFLSRHRGATGQYILPTRGSAEAAQAVLDAGETLGLLGDQYAGPKGYWAEFFGRPASCHKAIALFSLAGGAPLVVAYAKRASAPLMFEIGVVGVADPADKDKELSTVPDLTQWYNQQLESIVEMAPEQYWWLHRRWKDTRRRKKRRAASPRGGQRTNATSTD